jgi:ferric-dicitrate binding protein FerR (iron transport regulator)
VAKDKQKPFKVKVGDMQVAVLGTHFNIMAYDDEAAIKTTLLEGSVQVSRGAENNLLRPGQQAQLSIKGNIKVVSNADVAEAVAWKNGLTSFKNADVKSIMRQVARWYNVEVTYEGNIPERIFTGEIARNANLSAILKVLQLSGIHFKLEGKTIVVMP